MRPERWWGGLVLRAGLLALLVALVGVLIGLAVGRATRAGSQIAFVSRRLLEPDDPAQPGSREVSDIFLLDVGAGVVFNLTRSTTDDTHPAWSPDGAWLAFASRRDGNWNLYRMDAYGGHLRRLTDHPADDLSPAWSPDGTAIAFVSNRRGARDLYVMDASGQNVRQITDDAADDWFPAWSPDGRWLAFYSNRSGNDELYVLDLACLNLPGLCATAMRQVTSHVYDDGAPRWSPDGRSLVFASWRDGFPELYRLDVSNIRATLACIDLSVDCGLTRLTQNHVYDWFPDWSPDGAHIVFTSDRAGSVDLYVMRRDGTAVRQLTEHPAHDWSPAWRP